MNEPKPRIPMEEWAKEHYQFWGYGFEDGQQRALKDNAEALAIGNAILKVLDGRYEPYHNDHD